MIARHVKDIPTVRVGQKVALYRCDPPLDGNEYVIASGILGGDHECYLFAADDDGHVASWTELSGSCRGTVLHETAFRHAGYEVVR